MISVIIPLYNKRDSISRTIKSILNQSFSDFEILVIDDGSTDDSVEIINTNFSDTRIKIIQQKNGGVSKARNNGAKCAQGEWLAYLDADDYWLPIYLEKMHNATLLHPNANAIGCASYIVNDKTRAISTNHMLDDIYKKTVEINYFLFPDIMSHIGATLIRKEKFIELGGFNEELKNNEDILLLGSLVMNNQYIFIGEMLHIYSIGIDGQATRNPLLKEKFAKDSLFVINEFYSLYEKNPQNKMVIPSLKFRFCDFLLRHFKANDKNLVTYYIDNLCDGMKKNMIPLDWMKKKYFYKLGILYILLIKICWNLRGIQSRSHKSRYNKDLIQQFNKYTS